MGQEESVPQVAGRPFVTPYSLALPQVYSRLFPDRVIPPQDVTERREQILAILQEMPPMDDADVERMLKSPLLLQNTADFLDDSITYAEEELNDTLSIDLIEMEARRKVKQMMKRREGILRWFLVPREVFDDEVHVYVKVGQEVSRCSIEAVEEGPYVIGIAWLTDVSRLRDAPFRQLVVPDDSSLTESMPRASRIGSVYFANLTNEERLEILKGATFPNIYDIDAGDELPRGTKVGMSSPVLSLTVTDGSGRLRNFLSGRELDSLRLDFPKSHRRIKPEVRCKVSHLTVNRYSLSYALDSVDRDSVVSLCFNGKYKGGLTEDGAFVFPNLTAIAVDDDWILSSVCKSLSSDYLKNIVTVGVKRFQKPLKGYRRNQALAMLPNLYHLETLHDLDLSTFPRDSVRYLRIALLSKVRGSKALATMPESVEVLGVGLSRYWYDEVMEARRASGVPSQFSNRGRIDVVPGLEIRYEDFMENLEGFRFYSIYTPTMICEVGRTNLS
uniref:Uncharacterized protein n=1 Tax=viral metagenome TaxID=1070528 RepID=A0A6C0JXS2_9ZZZZ